MEAGADGAQSTEELWLENQKAGVWPECGLPHGRWTLYERMV